MFHKWYLLWKTNVCWRGKTPIGMRAKKTRFGHSGSLVVVRERSWSFSFFGTCSAEVPSLLSKAQVNISWPFLVFILTKMFDVLPSCTVRMGCGCPSPSNGTSPVSAPAAIASRPIQNDWNPTECFYHRPLMDTVPVLHSCVNVSYKWCHQSFAMKIPHIWYGINVSNQIWHKMSVINTHTCTHEIKVNRLVYIEDEHIQVHKHTIKHTHT